MSFEIRETMNKILSFIALIPLKSLLLPSGSHIVSCFSARAEIPFRLHEIFSDFLSRLAGLKILARFAKTGLGFSARAELRPGLNPSPCNRQFDFKRICFRSRAEIRHVIRPLPYKIWIPVKWRSRESCAPESGKGKGVFSSKVTMV